MRDRVALLRARGSTARELRRISTVGAKRSFESLRNALRRLHEQDRGRVLRDVVARDVIKNSVLSTWCRHDRDGACRARDRVIGPNAHGCADVFSAGEAEFLDETTRWCRPTQSAQLGGAFRIVCASATPSLSPSAPPSLRRFQQE